MAIPPPSQIPIHTNTPISVETQPHTITDTKHYLKHSTYNSRQEQADENQKQTPITEQHRIQPINNTYYKGTNDILVTMGESARVFRAKRQRDWTQSFSNKYCLQ